MFVSLLKKSSFLVNAYKKVRFSGNERYCPICCTSSSIFFPFSVPPAPIRLDAECPHCGSLERHRFLSLFIESEFFRSRMINILHVAPEGHLEAWLRNFFVGSNYITADLNKKDVDLCVDLCSICFRDDYFDLIICNHVLEHVDDDLLAMQEIRRVLSPSGYALLTIPQEESRAVTYEDKSVVSPEDRAREFGQSDHVRVYGKDFPERAESVGLAVEKVARYDFLSEDQARRMGITNFAGYIFRCSA